MKKVWTAAAAAALLALSACGGSDEPSTDTGGLDLEGDPVAGAEIFQNVCSACHGPNGEGAAGTPAIASEVPELSDQQIVTVIVDGKGRMPAQDFLSDQQVADVLAYLRQEFGP